MPKTNAQKQREYRERMKAAGKVRLSVWIDDDLAWFLKARAEENNMDLSHQVNHCVFLAKYQQPARLEIVSHNA